MRKHRIYIFCLLVISGFATVDTYAQTKIWIVRHAEKDLKNTSDSDPGLSLDGQDRAKDLASLLRPNRLLAVYATSTNRSTQTAQPTAYGHGLTVQTYDPRDPAGLVSTVLRNYKNGGVVIVGHSNTVLELVEAFGLKRPLPTLEEDRYDYVFALTVDDNSMGLLMSQYGKLPRTTAPK
ncbi:MAG: histidine phosphatase family protein [Bacteroidota bacterium]